MKIIGLDIGSRSIKLVFLKDGNIKEYLCTETSYNPKEQIANLLSNFKYDYLVSTGYGRYLAKEHFRAEILTEIQAHALGVRHIFPTARTILDIGGQDTKAILLDSSGKVLRFEMNDRCAAGTGRFLEVMARALGVDLQGLSSLALSAKTAAKISSLCTVFAESEVIGLIGRGEAREVIAKGIINSIAKRSLTLLKKVGAKNPIIFTGGVAYNKALVATLEELLGNSILVPENPQLTGALGAALYGSQRLNQRA
ncbi:acyl-CoA dehydratase activase [Thermodesulfatator atlanticus]|uniref:acyl-CoA dehydratase activase n=1 Tax=Thermodesulfatator atlanticus TaxID=501497 RepID=UPI0003B6C5AD|nr:acyl-CoA dehydratase activase [Thermodesulfatator atlanticus]